MTALLLDGRPVSRAIRDRARDELARFRNAYSATPSLAIVLIGDDPSAHAYRDAIVKASAGIEMPSRVVSLPSTVDQRRVNQAIVTLNEDPEVHGILVLQPLPPHLSRVDIADLIDPLKDIDGITTHNAGRLFHNDRDVLAPSTPAGGMALMKHYQVPIAGKHAVVIGRSPVVGLPMAAMLLAENATVTTCHSRTPDIAHFTTEADIVVSAVGKPATVQVTVTQNTMATFTWINTNVLQARCVNCHGNGKADGGFSIATYTSVTKAVVKGNSASSLLYTEVKSGSMPKSGADLTADQITAIKTWIDGGALNN